MATQELGAIPPGPPKIPPPANWREWFARKICTREDLREVPSALFLLFVVLLVVVLLSPFAILWEAVTRDYSDHPQRPKARRKCLGDDDPGMLNLLREKGMA